MSTIKNLSVKEDLMGSCDLLITGAQDGASKLSLSTGFTDLTKESIQKAFMGEKKFGSDKKRVILYNDNKIKRISVYGYIKDNKTDKVRSLAANIVSYAISNKVKSVAIDLKSFSITNKNLQAFCEGLVLGS